MISFYSGTPGSGKSLNVSKRILAWIKLYRKNVICVNMTVYTKEVYKSTKASRFNRIRKFLGLSVKNDILPRNKRGVLYNIDNDICTPEFLIDYALKFHVPRKESQTLIIIDEAQMLFNPTVVKERNKIDREYRTRWLKFFTQHRHMGFDIIIISQFDRLVDAQLRCLFEYNYIHRKVNNYGMAWVLNIFKVSLFMSVCYWYGANLRISSDFFFYSKKYSRIYDSYRLFDEELIKKSLKNQEKIVLNQIEK